MRRSPTKRASTTPPSDSFSSSSPSRRPHCTRLCASFCTNCCSTCRRRHPPNAHVPGLCKQCTDRIACLPRSVNSWIDSHLFTTSSSYSHPASSSYTRTNIFDKQLRARVCPVQSPSTRTRIPSHSLSNRNQLPLKMAASGAQVTSPLQMSLSPQLSSPALPFICSKILDSFARPS